MNKTIKVFNYRGVNCYVRHTEGRWFELLVAYKGGIFGHSLFVEKPHATEKRISLAEREEGVVKELTVAATVLIENLRREYSLLGRAKKRIHKLTTFFKTYGSKTASKFRSAREAE